MVTSPDHQRNDEKHRLGGRRESLIPAGGERLGAVMGLPLPE
ncbi:hypothetical protein [Actinoallomurus rhizosphaericola]|nr:hypothetical protein [Actinoallomurus rhizosphaericola]